MTEFWRQPTFTDALIGMTRHFEQGIALDNESLALDVIDAVGPGGGYLTHDHTLTHWRKLWIPGLFNRQRLEKWEAQGSKDIRAAIKDRTVALMDNHHVAPLSESTNSDIDTILQRGA